MNTHAWWRFIITDLAFKRTRHLPPSYTTEFERKTLLARLRKARAAYITALSSCLEISIRHV